jgi:hypothetical protein
MHILFVPVCLKFRTIVIKKPNNNIISSAVSIILGIGFIIVILKH